MKGRYRALLDEVRRDELKDRERVSLYLSKTALENFKRACGETSPSKVIERFMKSFAAETEKESA